MGGVCRWGVLVVCTAWAVLRAAAAIAAPDRLYDIVPDAVPDQKGALAFSWGRSEIGLEGPLASQQSVHNYYKLRYTFNPTSAVSFLYATHELGGAESYGLLTPLFDNQDSGTSLGFDFNVNLMDVPATPADKEKNVAFSAGSSFGLGLAGTMYKLEAGPLSENETLFNAYLVYSTDLTEELRAHTYFSSGRLTGDTHTGSVNRVGAGLDYTVIPGRRPLTLMANGVLDIYNFRKPTFNTSRVSTFEVGLRYHLAKDWFTSVGWTTVNDSENDVSGSGLFAGVNFVNMPAEKPKVCPPAPAGQPAAGDASQPPQQQAMAPPPEPAPTGEQVPGGGASESTSVTAQEAGKVAAEASGPEGASGAAPVAEPAAETTASGSSGTTGEQPTPSPAREPAAQGSGTSAEQGSSGEAQSEPTSGEASAGEDNGVAIPAFPDVLPEHTPENAKMLRPEAPGPAVPRHTAADSRMLRPEGGGVPAGIGPELASRPADEQVAPGQEVSAVKTDEAQKKPAVWGAGLISQQGVVVATERTAGAPVPSTGRAYLYASQARLAFLSIVRRP